MAADSCKTLITSGVDVLLHLRWQDVQAGISTRSITERAGVTTGSFFHHFRNRAHFAEVLTERFVEMWSTSNDALLADVRSFIGGEDGADVRSVAQADWLKVHQSATSDLLHLLWATRREPLSDDTDVTAGDVLARCYGSLTDAVVPEYERALQVLGREMMPPFDITDFAVAMTAVADGLEMRAGAQPGVVRDRLFADLISVVLVGITRPAGERAERIDLAAVEAQLAPRRRPATSPVTGDGQKWRQIADAAAPLFEHRLVSEVRVADIAEAAGVSSRTVYNQFGAVSAVAAAGWARHYPELEAISTAPYTTEEGPVARIEQVLTRFVEMAQANRGITEGLAHEVIAETRPEPSAPRLRPVHTTVPLPALLLPHVAELRARGLLRRRIENASLVGSMLQLVAMRVLMAGHEPVERIIDETLGVLLDGALVRGPTS